MPKRKNKDKKRKIARKIRRLEKRLNYISSSETSDNEDKGEFEDNGHSWDSPASPLMSENEIPFLPISDSEDDCCAQINNRPSGTRSIVVAASNTTPTPCAATSVTIPVSTAAPTLTTAPLPAAAPSTSAAPSTLPLEILEALGDPKKKMEVFGPNIPEEISERWGRVLVDGMSKELKQQLPEKYLIPENFRLAKAPLLNPEIIPVLNEASRNRDKLMERSQNQLGLGISELSNLASKVIKEDMSKTEILKNISEISQIFLDLHHEDTKRRRKLITASLDKKFLHVISDVKRDAYLFGNNLGDKIKASKTAERSGLQIKRPDSIPSTSYKRHPQQGNWRGPPRVQAQPTYRRGGPKNRYASQQTRRPPPTGDRPRTMNKPVTKSHKP